MFSRTAGAMRQQRMSAIAAVAEIAAGRRPALPETREKLRLTLKDRPANRR
jgi:hypothetical protein